MAAETCNMSRMWSKKMPQGLGLEISHQPHSMRHVANLIIAIERLKNRSSEEVLSNDFRDENLLSILLESIVEEKSIFERSSAPPQFSSTGEGVCSVTDSQKRSLVLVKNSLELNAVLLQGGNDSRKVFLNMSTYVLTSDSQAKPVALGIKDTNLYLSCYNKGDKPTLHLEAVEDKKTLSPISIQSEMKRFLFYKQDTGVNMTTLMSASCPNWYISTSTQYNEPVDMCQKDAARFQAFTIRPI
uniref:Interleukin-1 n=1 Tax=Iconisemion striatum TaxID=60296 RepID=A0A1A7WAA5_9TELE